MECVLLQVSPLEDIHLQEPMVLPRPLRHFLNEQKWDESTGSTQSQTKKASYPL